MNKDVAELGRHLRKLGLKVTPVKSGHLVVFKDGQRVYALPKTPGDNRWRKNAIGDLIRMGIIDEDPKFARPARAVNGGGQAPPPLPDFRKGSAALPTKTVSVTQDMIDTAMLVVQELQDHYGLKAREGRVVPHGTVPILALIMEAWEEETGLLITTPNYERNYDISDRREMTRLAAGRVADLVNSSVGSHIGPISAANVKEALSAVNWFARHDWNFPNGSTLEVNRRGVTLTPAPAARLKAAAEVDTRVALPHPVDATPEPQIDNLDEMSATEWLTGEVPPKAPEPLSLRIMAAIAFGGTKEEAMALAQEVADLEAR